ncbi:MAG: hypothetical protein NXY57DRAFT_969752 [Lentinula lateritia]|nr:MAG: hypothetical protein NXY57DRAFT_969752 [Lentinula lateritia]
MLSLAHLLNPAPDYCPPSMPATLSQAAAFKVETNVLVTRQTTVSKLYTYCAGAIVEYPETATEEHIGHLFEMDISNWFNPASSFAYSQGRPEGFSTKSTKGSAYHCNVLVDEDGNKAPGCTSPPYEPTLFDKEELAQREAIEHVESKIRWGHQIKLMCSGRLLLEYTSQGRAYVQCEHFNRQTSRGHLINYDVGSGLYDLEYLEALFRNNVDEIEFIESNAQADGYGPLAPCSTIVNFSSQRIDCRRSSVCIHSSG